MPETRICHVNVARDYRGGERQTELLIRELEKRGVAQSLVCRRAEPLTRRLSDVDVELREVAGNPISVAFAARGTLIHVHEGRSVYGAYLRHLVSGTPYVITRRVDNPIRDHRWAHKTYRAAAAVACVAPQVGDIVRQFDAEINVTVVHSGSSGFRADADAVRALRERWRGKFVVGHVGALDNAQKGQEFIINVARECERQHRDLHFVLVGGGRDETFLRELAGPLSNVTFAGFVDNVGDYLGAFDLFILPSNREGIGSILFDAMAQRLAIVASRVGGVPDIVHDGENGILIDPASPQQLLAAIVRLRADDELRTRLGTAGAAVAARYTAAAMCEKYLDIYSRALSRPVGAAV